MRPEDDTNHDMNGDVDAMRRAARAAADRLDERPDSRVRAAVVAAAARQVGAKPRPVSIDRIVATSERSAPRRWPWSAVALLVVSIGAGLVAMRALRDDPERVVNVASNAGPPTAANAPLQLAENEIVRAKVMDPESPISAKPPLPEPVSPSSPKRPPVARAAPRAADRSAPDTARDANVVAPAETPREVAAPKAAPASTLDAPAVSAPSVVPALERAAPAAPMRLRSTRAIEPLTPEAWVERIVKLRADGNDDEADRDLAALRLRYPDFRVPPAALAPSGTR